ncbi:MAG: hypothetical protein WED15_08260 [Akkermansiaceae bacterium]
MNSDSHDSAAWRAFGMLDADESAIFDDAMRQDPALHNAYQEMNRLSAAIGVATVAPVKPRACQLALLQNQLGFQRVKRSHHWMGVSGWAAAAVLAGFLVIERQTPTETRLGTVADTHKTALHSNPQGRKTSGISPEGDLAVTASSARLAALELAPSAALSAEITKANAKKETVPLIQEIEVLRENLAKFQRRDRLLFEPIPGVAVPVIMTMRPPNLDPHDKMILAQMDLDLSITAMLGDALKLTYTQSLMGAEGAAIESTGPTASLSATLAESAVTAPTMTTPSAIPIYDAARDLGTLVISHLPAVDEGRAYHLWVTTQFSETPIHVGSLPETSEGAASFDFNLGSTNILPSRFVLTMGQVNQPAPPSGSNIVLQGPAPGGP